MHASELGTRAGVGRRVMVAAVAGVALVEPFVTMEWRATGFPDGAPIALFIALWLLAAAFTLAAWPAASGIARGEGAARALLRRWPTVLVALLLAWVWIALVRDQWPCFRGVPNCD